MSGNSKTNPQGTTAIVHPVAARAGFEAQAQSQMQSQKNTQEIGQNHFEMENANGTTTVVRRFIETVNEVRGRFDDIPFRCSCVLQSIDSQHWDGCPFHLECLRLLRIQDPYDKVFFRDYHHANQDGSITRIRMRVAEGCGCRGSHRDDCPEDGLPNLACYCVFLDPKKPKHADVCRWTSPDRERADTDQRRGYVRAQQRFKEHEAQLLRDRRERDRREGRISQSRLPRFKLQGQLAKIKALFHHQPSEVESQPRTTGTDEAQQAAQPSLSRSSSMTIVNFLAPTNKGSLPILG